MVNAVTAIEYSKHDAQPVEIIPGIMLGSIGSASHSSIMHQHGITHILCVGGGIADKFPREFQYMHIDVKDSPDVDLCAHFPMCFGYIRTAIQAGGRVLIFCLDGRRYRTALM